MWVTHVDPKGPVVKPNGKRYAPYRLIHVNNHVASLTRDGQGVNMRTPTFKITINDKEPAFAILVVARDGRVLFNSYEQKYEAMKAIFPGIDAAAGDELAPFEEYVYMNFPTADEAVLQALVHDPRE